MGSQPSQSRKSDKERGHTSPCGVGERGEDSDALAVLSRCPACVLTMGYLEVTREGSDIRAETFRGIIHSKAREANAKSHSDPIKHPLLIPDGKIEYRNTNKM